MPLISIVIPTHNRPEMLAEALASVRRQTFADYEIIVVSNGETDDNRRTSKAVTKANGCAWYVLNDGNVGSARNLGITRAGGRWIAFLDDDDLWMPDKLEKQLAAAEQTGVDMVTCDYIEMHSNGPEKTVRPRFNGMPPVKAASHQYWWSLPSATMVRAAVFREIGGFDSGLIFAEDCDMWRRISWRHKILQMEEPLVRYRIGHPRMMQRETLKAMFDIAHLLKMRWDTPRDLRWALPEARTFIGERIRPMAVPYWIRQPRKAWKRSRLNGNIIGTLCLLAILAVALIYAPLPW